MFCSIHDFTFLMTETKIKGQVSLSFVFVMLPAQLIALANWFAWVPACTSAIAWVSVCVKERTCLRIAISVNCFNIFGSIFGLLFSLLIKKLMLGSKTIWQSMRKFPCAIWSVRVFPHMDKEEIFFSQKLHVDMVWFVVDKYLSLDQKI